MSERVWQRWARAPLAWLDARCNRLYGSRYNPLYHSGALAVGCLIVLAVTGLYLLLFYRIGDPYGSVSGLADQRFAGRWIRSLHRYVSDLAVVAIAVHVLRMAVQNRTWGPRALAWLSGIVLTGLMLVCGWTGYVMVWDDQALMFAVEGARLFDVFPIFSEPLLRSFVGERPMPSAFFFLNLFAHIAIPVGILMVLWIHVSRLARTNLLPPKELFWGTVALFTVLAIAWPAVLGPEADPLRVSDRVAIDLFYGFWLPLARAVPPIATWTLLLLTTAAVAAVPWLTRPKPGPATAPSWVEPRFCTGCEQCYHDCPYEAISMVPREDDRPYPVGLVDPSKCVSCGICAGSCGPMGVGPAGRTGRDQLNAVRALLSERPPTGDQVVLVGCSKSAAGWGSEEVAGAAVFPVSCAGSMHTSVVEFILRGGAGGVMVVACPTRDCWNREGVLWMEERIYNEREAELKARVDRTRLRVVRLAEGERAELRSEVERFRGQIGLLERVTTEVGVEIEAVCEPPVVSVLDEGGVS